MSTRSIFAVETESGVVGVHVHSDGYPDGESGRLATYRALIERDGAAKVCETILAGKAWGHIFAEEVELSLPADGTPVAGYGVAFDDVSDPWYFRPEHLAEWWDSQYIYVVNPETGEIRWADLGVGRARGATWDRLKWRREDQLV